MNTLFLSQSGSFLPITRCKNDPATVITSHPIFSKIRIAVIMLIAGSCLLLTASSTQAQQNDPAKVWMDRAAKIVSGLQLNDENKSSKVQQIIASQYRDLSHIQNQREEAIKQLKAGGENKEAIKKVQDKAAEEIEALHKSYIKNLSANLTAGQVDKVKDGMTYNVVNITYDGYLQMIPELTAEQKIQIKSWLVEAREHAMDAETSDKKHAWFGKYKGKINNYLSAAGYDLKKAGDDWEKRRNQNKQPLKAPASN